MAIIEVRDLHYAYPPLLSSAKLAWVLRGVDLRVERGEFLAIMGPTGGGKSTLCMALNGIVPQSTGGIIRGQVTVLERDVRHTPVAEMAMHVGIVYQDPESQLFCPTVEDEVAFGPENLGLPRTEIAERLAWALGVVGMSAHRLRSPTQLSGGQKQRVAIAASLAMLPEVLILDEPTSGLDPVGQSEVLAVIEHLCRQRSMTIVMVSQDGEQVAEYADRLAVLWQGRIVRADEPLRIFEDTELLAQMGIGAPQVTELAGALNRRCETAYHFAQLDAAERALRRDLESAQARGEGVAAESTPPGNMGAAISLPLREGDEAHPHIPCVRIERLHYHYDAEVPALNGVDLEIYDNAYLAIVGQNGSGKTTLVKHLNGLLKPVAGRVWVYGRDTTAVSVGELAHTVGYVFQNPDHQIFCPTTREEISFGPRNLGLVPAEVRERADEALSAFGLLPYADIPPAVLGYGLRRKVSIAAVYAMRPRLFILDEPTAGLDWRSARELLRRIALLHDQGHTIILVTHDMHLAAECAREMLVMHEGRVLARGSVREVFGRVEELQRAQITPPQVTRLARRLAHWGLPENLLTVDEFCQAYALLSGACPCLFPTKERP